LGSPVEICECRPAPLAPLVNETRVSTSFPDHSDGYIDHGWSTSATVVTAMKVQLQLQLQTATATAQRMRRIERMEDQLLILMTGSL